MSTSTLLFVTTWLRGVSHADRSWRPAPSTAPNGRGRFRRESSNGRMSSFGSLFSFRRVSAGDRPSRSPLAGRPGVPLACADVLRLSTHVRVLLTVCVLSLGFASDTAQAQESATPTASVAPVRVGGNAAAGTPCVQVDIGGHRAGHLECATQALEEAARIARRDAEAARDISVAQAGSPDVQVGVASRSATRLRLRENFGVSVRPPAHTPVYTNPMGRRP